MDSWHQLMFSLLRKTTEVLNAYGQPLDVAMDVMAFIYGHSILKHLFLLSAITCIVFGLEAIYERTQGKSSS
jgi:hypothetical protein